MNQPLDQELSSSHLICSQTSQKKILTMDTFIIHSHVNIYYITIL